MARKWQRVGTLPCHDKFTDRRQLVVVVACELRIWHFGMDASNSFETRRKGDEVEWVVFKGQRDARLNIAMMAKLRLNSF